MQSQDINTGERPTAALTRNFTALNYYGEKENLEFMILASTLKNYDEKDKLNPK